MIFMTVGTAVTVATVRSYSSGSSDSHDIREYKFNKILNIDKFNYRKTNILNKEIKRKKS